MSDAKYLHTGVPNRSIVAAPTFNSFTLNESGDKIEFIFQSPAGGSVTVTRLGVRVTSITGTTPNYKISLQGVDGTGRSDGTIKGGASPASKVFSASALGWAAGSWNWLNLDNSYVTASGESLSIVVTYDSGTIDASNNASFTTSASVGTTIGFPYVVTFDATGSVVNRASALPILGFGTTGKAYGYPLKTVTTQTFSSSSSPNEYALKFTVPSGWSDTFKIQAIRGLMQFGAASSVLFQLYQGGNVGDTTVLQNYTQDSDVASATSIRLAEVSFDESTLSTLNTSLSYRVGLAPQSAVNFGMVILDVDQAADWDAWEGGQDFMLSTRTSAGNWTDAPTRRPMFELTLADIAKSAVSAGGGSIFGSGVVTPYIGGRQ